MKDFLGQELTVGDYVAGLYSSNNTPHLFIIHGFTPRKVKLAPAGDGSGTHLKYPDDLLLMDSENVNRLLAQKPKDKLGVPLAVDDHVFLSNGEYIEPMIAKIINFSGDTAMIEKIFGKCYMHGSSRLLTDLIKIDPKLITMHLLSRETSNE